MLCGRGVNERGCRGRVVIFAVVVVVVVVVVFVVVVGGDGGVVVVVVVVGPIGNLHGLEQLRARVRAVKGERGGRESHAAAPRENNDQ